MGIVVDYLSNIGLDVVRDRIKDSAMESAARDRLRDYLARQKRINEVCTREEELDFERLASYIQEELIEDVKVRLFGESEERARARQTILSKATSYAQAKTNLSKKRVQKMIEDSIAILRGYYHGKVNKELLFVAAQIEDTISKGIDAAEQDISTRIDQVDSKIGAANLLSLDTNVALAQAGNLAQVESNLSSAIKAISSTHKLFPYYGYGMEGQDSLVSIPLTADATTMYPPRFNVTASSVRLGDAVINRIDDDVLSKSYRHQLPISMDVVTAKKYLGDILDPSQKEADQITGAHVVMTPPPFPPAFACSISINDDTYFEYVLLRTKEILDDGTVIISNEEQKRFPFEITMSYHHQSKQFSLSIHLHSPSNVELLNYYRFISSMARGGELQIKALSMNEVFVKGPATTADNDDYSFEIHFLEMIVKIEKAFDCSFNLPKAISQNDYNTVEHLYMLLETGKYEGSWTNMDFEFTVTSITKQRVSELTDACYTLWYFCPATIDLFGTELQFPIMRNIKCAQVYDLEKTKRKVEVLDDGDLIKIKYIPGNKNKTGVYYDYISPDENDSSVVYADIDQ